MVAPVDPESHERRQKRAARFQETTNNGPGLFSSLIDNLNSTVRQINLLVCKKALCHSS